MFGISAADGTLEVGLVRKCWSGIVCRYMLICTHTCTCVSLYMCAFSNHTEARSRRRITVGGCESGQQRVKGVHVQHIHGLECGRRDGQGKAGGVRGQLRRQCVTSGMEKWKRIFLCFHLEKEHGPFPQKPTQERHHRLGVRMLRFSWTLQLDEPRLASTLGSERGASVNLGLGDILLGTGLEKLCCLSELEFTER